MWDAGLIPGSGRWEKAWQPTSIFLPRESHGQKSLEGYGPQSYKELDMVEVTCHACVGLLLDIIVYSTDLYIRYISCIYNMYLIYISYIWFMVTLRFIYNSLFIIAVYFDLMVAKFEHILKILYFYCSTHPHNLHLFILCIT